MGRSSLSRGIIKKKFGKNMRDELRFRVWARAGPECGGQHDVRREAVATLCVRVYAYMYV